MAKKKQQTPTEAYGVWEPDDSFDEGGYWSYRDTLQDALEDAEGTAVAVFTFSKFVVGKVIRETRLEVQDVPVKSTKVKARR